jgi:hypothetical protein
VIGKGRNSSRKGVAQVSTDTRTHLLQGKVPAVNSENSFSSLTSSFSFDHQLYLTPLDVGLLTRKKRKENEGRYSEEPF